MNRVTSKGGEPLPVTDRGELLSQWPYCLKPWNSSAKFIPPDECNHEGGQFAKWGKTWCMSCGTVLFRTEGNDVKPKRDERGRFVARCLANVSGLQRQEASKRAVREGLRRCSLTGESLADSARYALQCIVGNPYPEETVAVHMIRQAWREQNP